MWSKFCFKIWKRLLAVSIHLYIYHLLCRPVAYAFMTKSTNIGQWIVYTDVYCCVHSLPFQKYSKLIPSIARNSGIFKGTNSSGNNVNILQNSERNADVNANIVEILPKQMQMTVQTQKQTEDLSTCTRQKPKQSRCNPQTSQPRSSRTTTSAMDRRQILQASTTISFLPWGSLQDARAESLSTIEIQTSDTRDQPNPIPRGTVLEICDPNTYSAVVYIPPSSSPLSSSHAKKNGVSSSPRSSPRSWEQSQLGSLRIHSCRKPHFPTRRSHKSSAIPPCVSSSSFRPRRELRRRGPLRRKKQA